MLGPFSALLIHTAVIHWNAEIIRLLLNKRALRRGGKGRKIGSEMGTERDSRDMGHVWASTCR